MRKLSIVIFVIPVVLALNVEAVFAQGVKAPPEAEKFNDIRNTCLLVGRREYGERT
jgi:hypothetical protein